VENRGVKKGQEYAILTDEITKRGVIYDKQYKDYKLLRRESSWHMTNLELFLICCRGETTEISKEKKPKTFKENQKIAKQGGQLQEILERNWSDQKENITEKMRSN